MTTHVCHCIECTPAAFPASLHNWTCAYLAERDDGTPNPTSIVCDNKYYPKTFAADDKEGWIAVFCDIQVRDSAHLHFAPHICLGCGHGACAEVLYGHVEFIRPSVGSEVVVA